MSKSIYLSNLPVYLCIFFICSSGVMSGGLSQEPVCCNQSAEHNIRSVAVKYFQAGAASIESLSSLRLSPPHWRNPAECGSHGSDCIKIYLFLDYMVVCSLYYASFAKFWWRNCIISPCLSQYILVHWTVISMSLPDSWQYTALIPQVLYAPFWLWAPGPLEVSAQHCWHTESKVLWVRV